MADNLAEPKARELALLRYFLLNLGGIGPLLGVTYGLSARQETFLLLSAAICAWLHLVIGFQAGGLPHQQPGGRAACVPCCGCSGTGLSAADHGQSAADAGLCPVQFALIISI
jgi:hypothetical protein